MADVFNRGIQIAEIQSATQPELTSVQSAPGRAVKEEALITRHSGHVTSKHAGWSGSNGFTVRRTCLNPAGELERS